MFPHPGCFGQPFWPPALLRRVFDMDLYRLPRRVPARRRTPSSQWNAKNRLHPDLYPLPQEADLRPVEERYFDPGKLSLNPSLAGRETGLPLWRVAISARQMTLISRVFIRNKIFDAGTGANHIVILISGIATSGVRPPPDALLAMEIFYPTHLPQGQN